MQALLTALKILSFLGQNRDHIKQAILSLEELMPSSSGIDKAQVVKNMIATALSIESSIEAVWPTISPVFNAFVAFIKSKVEDPAVTPSK